MSLALLSGCGVGVDGHFPVSGNVNLGGTPVPKGRVAFQPTSESGGSSASGDIVDGKYSIPAEKGLTPGEYNVIFTIEEPTGKMIEYTDHSGEVYSYEETASYVPLDWGARSTQKVTIEPTRNKFDFDVPRSEEPVEAPGISGNPSGDK